MKEDIVSKSGYFASGILLLLSVAHFFFYEQLERQFSLSLLLEERLCLIILITFFFMLCYELLHLKIYSNVFVRLEAKRTFKQLLPSTLFRYLTYLLLIFIPFFIVNQHYYFQQTDFFISRLFYSYLFYIYFFLGLPYIYFTLKYKGHFKYDYNDYAVLTMIAFKAILWRLFQTENRNKFNVLRNRRIKKVFLVFLVNFFFLSLMTKFFWLEYTALEQALYKIVSNNFSSMTFYRQYHLFYLLIYHLIFIVDVGLAIIGYTVASRWLNNRTKSVDMTLYGWAVVLLCYPPMNSGFTSQLIGYNQFPTKVVVTSEWVSMLLMFLIICCFFIYVWSTAALGFKFSNLTNRGIISHGPYALLRHPAYASKNLAWWLDNTHLFSNGWSMVAMLIWNLIYFLRGITEEHHLSKDKTYQTYKNKVKYRFIPFIW
ncbi:MAG: hypothetical protein GY694_20840 [Gammaproteobacteria bacterium]|nr:hypothetical protein [Gammaproteobacteria bacterium]